MLTKKEKEFLMESLEQNVLAANKHKIYWDQRRYEIAKDLYVQNCLLTKLNGDNSAADTFKAAALLSVVIADYLIKALKERERDCNPWHKVSDGNLPVGNCCALCLYKPGKKDNYPTVKYLHYDFADGNWSDPNSSRPIPLEEPDYWMELPALPE